MHCTTGVEERVQNMAQVWHTPPATSSFDAGTGASFKGLRSAEQSWRRLEMAAAGGDALELAAASALAAKACLADEDRDEAEWHLQRGHRFLDLHGPCPRGLALQCDLAELGLLIAQRCEPDDVPTARRLRDDTRDVLFQIVRDIDAGLDGDAPWSTLHRVAGLLDALGDHSDAETVRDTAAIHFRPPAAARHN